MDLRTFTEPQQGASYEQLLAVARATETAGLDAFFRSDHYLRMGDGNPLPGPTDAWITMAALARETERIRLGTLVSSATFRLPGPLAISVAQVDEMSGVRVELGIGAGWFAEEHLAYGIPYPESVGERFDRLEEQLAIITGLWSTPLNQRFSYAGRHYLVENSPGLPKPHQKPSPPVIIGGKGTRRTPKLAARYAAECNVPFPENIGEAAAVFSGLDAACAAIDRDPGDLVRSIALTCCIGEDDATVERRATAIGKNPEELRRLGGAGRPEEVAQRLADYAGLGVSRVYLQLLDLSDLEHVALIGEALSPLVAGT
ncbi:MAG: putative F420-dependent oxidoreductase [Acidimicrobiaceae bacterium]|nr:putative F420-dependent oxidoreductase [Acidimicrobiaceae bacterium]